MAEAQYETRTRTVEEKVVILTLTEAEASELRKTVMYSDATEASRDIFDALSSPTTLEPSADTFEYEGATYDLNGVYRDCDGDTWHFARFDDVVVGSVDHKPLNSSDGPRLPFVMRYRPLTKTDA